jgi:hypothetical protein
MAGEGKKGETVKQAAFVVGCPVNFSSEPSVVFYHEDEGWPRLTLIRQAYSSYFKNKRLGKSIHV